MESSVVSDKRRPVLLILLSNNYVKLFSPFMSALSILTFNRCVLFGEQWKRF
jgi:hypothetical protein